MARIRSIKPEFWQDERLAKLSRDDRLLFLGLISAADDEGRMRGSPLLIKALVFPYEADFDLEAALERLVSARRIVRYECDGESFIWVRNFNKHQRIDKPSKSALPEPPADDSPSPPRTLREPSTNPPVVAKEDSRRDWKGVEWMGRDGIVPLAEKPAAVGEPLELLPPEPAKPTRSHAVKLALVAKFTVMRRTSYAWAGAKDGAALKALLAMCADDEEILRRWERALASLAFPGTSSLAVFVSRFNEYAGAGPPKDVAKGRVAAESVQHTEEGVLDLFTGARIET